LIKFTLKGKGEIWIISQKASWRRELPGCLSKSNKIIKKLEISKMRGNRENRSSKKFDRKNSAEKFSIEKFDRSKKNPRKVDFQSCIPALSVLESVCIFFVLNFAKNPKEKYQKLLTLGLTKEINIWPKSPG